MSLRVTPRDDNEHDSLDERWLVGTIPGEKRDVFEDVVGVVVSPQFAQRWVLEVMEELARRGFELEEGILDWIRGKVQGDPFERRGREEVMAFFDGVRFDWSEDVESSSSTTRDGSGEAVSASSGHNKTEVDGEEVEVEETKTGDDENADTEEGEDDMADPEDEGPQPLTYELWQSFSQSCKIYYNKRLRRTYET